MSSGDAARFREAARSWLVDHVPRDPRPLEGPAVREFDTAWQRAQFEGGWAGITWPARYGGRGRPRRDQVVWAEECAAAGAPYAGACYVGLNHAGPTLLAHGSEEQRRRHLEPILRGEVTWCQGFSEPDAGSDLANIRTSGELVGDHLVVNGRKIWSSWAQFADFQELLVRTDRSQRHGGLTWVICDMRSLGVEVRPIRSMARHEPFCEVTYTDVRVPLADVVGGIGNGWKVAMTTFGFERGVGFLSEQMELDVTVERLLADARVRGALELQPALGERFAHVRAQTAALGALARSLVDDLDRDPRAADRGVLVRVLHGELVQEVHALAMDLLGPDALEFRPWGTANGWTGSYLRSFAATIGGGTTEIARDLIGERVLHLPRTRRGSP